ncbi:MAG: hypothetical protein FJ029_13085 [Actinobacteria bacterium]|nr:hypothetical protein [Actinomycetota bacterium]
MTRPRRLLAVAIALALLALPAAASALSFRPNDLLQVPGREHVWLIDAAGARRWVADLTAFQRLRLDWRNVQRVPQNELDAVPLGRPHYTYRPVVQRTTGRVYMFDGAQRRWIPNLATFSGLGMRWEDVLEALPGLDVFAFPEGPPIAIASSKPAAAPASPTWEVLNASLTRDQARYPAGPRSYDHAFEEQDQIVFGFRIAGLAAGAQVVTRWTWGNGSRNDLTHRWNGDAQRWSYHGWSAPLPIGAGAVTLVIDGQAVRTDPFEVRYSLDDDVNRGYLALVQTAFGRSLVQAAAARMVSRAFGPLPANVHGRFRPYHNEITLSAGIRSERSEALATVLGHELWHANFTATYAPTSEGCVQNEVDAFAAQATVWSQLGRPAVQTVVEAQIDRMYELWRADGLRDLVVGTAGYQQQCNLVQAG